VLREFLPWNQILNYLEAVVRVYNRYGRRDNLYKARIKILVKAEGQRYIDEVECRVPPDRRARRRPAHHHPGRMDRVSRLLCAARTACAPARRRQPQTMAPARRRRGRRASLAAGCSSNVAPHKNPACAP
jgi:sulfite reductase (NADPH) hemoprotein beta-component